MTKDLQEQVYLPSAEFGKFLEKEREQYRASFVRLGLVK